MLCRKHRFFKRTSIVSVGVQLKVGEIRMIRSARLKMKVTLSVCRGKGGVQVVMEVSE